MALAVGPPRVGEDRPVAERPWAVFHRSVEAPDDHALRQRFGDNVVVSQGSRTSCQTRSTSRIAAMISSRVYVRSKQAAFLAVAAPDVRMAGQADNAGAAICSAAPSAPPASPEAGWIHMSRNSGRSRSSLPFETQFSATPPARHRFWLPVVANACRAIRNIASSMTACADAAMFMYSVVSMLSGSRRGEPSRSSNAALVANSVVKYPKYFSVQSIRSVLPKIEHIVHDQIDISRLTIGCESHQLVFAGIYLKAAVMRECAINRPSEWG